MPLEKRRLVDNCNSRGVPTPFAATTTRSADWRCSLSFAVDVDDSGGAALGVDFDLSNGRPGDQSGSEFDGVGPVGDVRGPFGMVDAPPHAGTALHACTLIAVVLGGDGVASRPPVPPEPVVCGCHQTTRFAQGCGLHRILRDIWKRGVTGVPGYPEVLFDLVVERAQILICQWPVVGDPVEGSDSEVGRHQAHPDARVHHAASADTVPDQRLNIRLGRVDRVIRVGPAYRRLR